MHGGRMAPQEGHLWATCGNINSGETHTQLTMTSHWLHIIFTKATQHPYRPQEKIWEFLGLSEADATQHPHMWGSFHVDSATNVVIMQSTCGPSAALVRNARKTVINDPHGVCHTV